MTATASSVDALAIVTLVIASIGALTGVASLAWSIAGHFLSGARVKVELEVGWAGPGGIIHGPIASATSTPPAGFNQMYPVVCVLVRNVGRLRASITGYSVRVGKLGYFVNGHGLNKPFPHPLDTGENELWVTPLDDVLATIHAHRETFGEPTKIRARVDLGDGREITSKNFCTPRQLGA